MKKEVMNLLVSPPNLPELLFNEAFALYRKSEGKNLQSERFLNAAGYTAVNLENVLYDLKQLHGITDAEVRMAKAIPVVAETDEKKNEVANEKEIKVEVTATTKEEVFTTAPDDVKEAVKLRDEFPFLDDPDCPEELYILVGKKLAHYHAYVKAHKALMVIVKKGGKSDAVEMTDEEIFALALSAVENFEANQNIYAELKHYADTKTILGAHPIFAERNTKSAVELMSIPDATTRMSNLENYIRRDTKKLVAKKTSDLEKEKINKKLVVWNYELLLIKAKLGFSAGK